MIKFQLFKSFILPHFHYFACLLPITKYKINAKKPSSKKFSINSDNNIQMH